MLYTVGYQRLPIKRLDDLVECLEIALLSDVRKRPFSHIPGYSSGALVARYGDKYTMKGKVLGGGGNVTDEGIEWLEQASKGKNVMIMCMEDFPIDCHRHTAICAPHFPEAVHYYDGQLFEAGAMEKAMLEELDDVPTVGTIEFD